MKISELIQKLEKIKEQHGNISIYRFIGDHIGDYFEVEKVNLLYTDEKEKHNIPYGLELY